MIEPVLSDDTLLADVRRAASDKEALHLWWLGQSGFLVQWNGRYLLLDPYLSDSLTKKYANSDKPHVRMTARVVAPERLDFIDVVTSSHNHTDHLDAVTLLPLFKTNPNLKFVIPEANRQFVADRLKCDPSWPIGVNVGTSVLVNGFEFHGVPARHDVLSPQFLGYVIRFGGASIYHSGDTLWDDSIIESVRPFHVDVALLPINGHATERRVAGNLTGAEAARLAKDIGARLVIPMHYEMFEFNTASPDEFVAEARRLGQPFRVLRCGERWGDAVGTSF